MKTLKLSLMILSFFSGTLTFAQVTIDHSIQLTGSGTNAEITGIKSVVNNQDATNVGAIQQGGLIYSADAGTANAYVVTLVPAATGYTAGMVVNFKAANANTGASTINVNGLGAQTIKIQVNSDLAANDIAAGQLVSVMYDGTNFQMISPVPSASSSNMSFTLSAKLTSLTCTPGANTSGSPDTLTCSFVSGTNLGPVSFQVSGLPSGVSPVFSAAGGFPTFTSILTLSLTSGVTGGTYPITITAVGGSANQSVTIDLNVVIPKRVFVTSTSYTGNLGGISGANADCQARANAKSLGGTWKAWLSDGTNSNEPSSDFTQNAYVLLNGVTVATSWANLTSNVMLSSVNIDENGNSVPGASNGGGSGASVGDVWTNTNANGTYTNNSNTCSAWTSIDGNGNYGNTYSYVNGSWTVIYLEACSNPCRLYCFEQ